MMIQLNKFRNGVFAESPDGHDEITIEPDLSIWSSRRKIYQWDDTDKCWYKVLWHGRLGTVPFHQFKMQAVKSLGDDI